MLKTNYDGNWNQNKGSLTKPQKDLISVSPLKKIGTNTYKNTKQITENATSPRTNGNETMPYFGKDNNQNSFNDQIQKQR